MTPKFKVGDRVKTKDKTRYGEITCVLNYPPTEHDDIDETGFQYEVWCNGVLWSVNEQYLERIRQYSSMKSGTENSEMPRNQ